MSGMDGFREKSRNCGEKFVHFWKNRREYVVGAALHGNQVSVVQMKHAEGEWQLSECVIVPFVPLPEENPVEHMAEKLSIAFKTLGWAPAPLSVCLLGEEVFQGRTQLPFMEDEEMREAVHWDIEGRGIFEGEDFLFDFLDAAGGDGCCMTAIRRARAEEWERAFRKNGLELAALTAMPDVPMETDILDRRTLVMGKRRFHALLEVYEGFFHEGGWNALFAATVACFPGEQRPNLLRDVAPPTSEKWNWRRLGAGVFAAAAIGMAGLFLADQVQIAAAEEAVAEQGNQLALLGQEQQKMEQIGQAIRETEQKQQMLARLSEEGFPWRSALAHFGTMTVDGVSLSQIAQRDGRLLELQGEAVSYDALAEFLKKFETDRDFFPKGPILKESHVATGKDRPDSVQFTVALKPE